MTSFWRSCVFILPWILRACVIGWALEWTMSDLTWNGVVDLVRAIATELSEWTELIWLELKGTCVLLHFTTRTRPLSVLLFLLPSFFVSLSFFLCICVFSLPLSLRSSLFPSSSPFPAPSSHPSSPFHSKFLPLPLLSPLCSPNSFHYPHYWHNWNWTSDWTELNCHD